MEEVKQSVSELQILIAKQAIIDALAAYSFAWDGDPLKPEGDPEAWADAFVEDGVFEAISAGGVVDDRWATRAQRIEGARKLHIGSKTMGDPWKMHHFMQQIMWDELTPTTATIRVSALIPVVNNTSGMGEAISMPMGVYFDKWVKTKDGWKIASRTFRHDITMGMPHGTAGVHDK